jgi:hypothetical protein
MSRGEGLFYGSLVVSTLCFAVAAVLVEPGWGQILLAVLAFSGVVDLGLRRRRGRRRPSSE